MRKNKFYLIPLGENLDFLEKLLVRVVAWSFFFTITSEAKLQALRQKLADLHYYESFTSDSAALVDRLLSDVVSTTDKYKEVEKRAQSFQSQADSLWRENADLSQTTADLHRVNADLHARHLSFTRDNEAKSRQLQSEVLAMADANEQLQLVIVQESFSKASLETSLHNLKRRLADITTSVNHNFRGELPIYIPPPSTPATTTVRSATTTVAAEVARLDAALQSALADNARLRSQNASGDPTCGSGGDSGSQREIERLNQVIDHLNAQYQELKRMRYPIPSKQPTQTTTQGTTTLATTQGTTTRVGVEGSLAALEAERAQVRALTRRLAEVTQSPNRYGGSVGGVVGGGRGVEVQLSMSPEGSWSTPPPALEELSGAQWSEHEAEVKRLREKVEEAERRAERAERERRTLDDLLGELTRVKEQKDSKGEVEQVGKEEAERELRQTYEAALVILETQVKEYKKVVAEKEEELRRAEGKINEEVEIRLEELSVLVEKLDAENSRLTKELECEKKNPEKKTRIEKIVALDGTVRELESTVQAIKRDLRETLLAKRHLEEELSIERNNSTKLGNEVATMREQCTRLETLIASIDDSKSDLLHRLAMSEREAERLKRETAELADAASSQAVGKDSLMKELAEYKEHMVLVSSAKDELSRVCDSQAERLDALNRALRQTELAQVETHRTTENLKRKVGNLEAEVATKEDTIRSLSSRLSAASEEVAKTSGALASKKKELTDAMDDVRVLVEEVNKWKTALAEAERVSQAGKRDLGEAKRRLETALQALRATEIERDDVLGLYRQSTGEVENRKFQVDVLEREKKQLHAAVGDAVRAIEEARHTEAVLRGEVRARDLDVTALKERVQLLSVQLDQVLAEGDEGRRGVGRLMHEMKMQEEIQRVLEEQRVGFEREVARLEADVHELVTKLRTCEARLDRKTSELDDAERRYQALAAYRAETATQGHAGHAGQGAGVQELLQTIEQQYRMIGELDSEVETLKSRLANNSAVF